MGAGKEGRARSIRWRAMKVGGNGNSAGRNTIMEVDQGKERGEGERDLERRGWTLGMLLESIQQLDNANSIVARDEMVEECGG